MYYSIPEAVAISTVLCSNAAWHLTSLLGNNTVTRYYHKYARPSIEAFCFMETILVMTFFYVLAYFLCIIAVGGIEPFSTLM